jgi:uncharacterized protein with PIN domain
MNNIYAEADEILRTSNKKQIVSIILSMQGNYLRAREAEDRLAEAQELIKKLRRCANCKHQIEYVLFGEVATACTLDVNEEKNQTCKNFDKWELE